MAAGAEDLTSEILAAGGVEEFLDRLFPDLSALRSRGGNLASRVAWEVSTAEEDYRGGGEDAADFVPAARRFLRHGSTNLDKYRNEIAAIEQQRSAHVESLTALRAALEEFVLASQLEQQIGLAKKAGDALSTFNMAAAALDGHGCFRVLETLRACAQEVRSAADAGLESHVERMCFEAIITARRAFEQDLKVVLESAGYPFKVPDDAGSLGRIQNDLAFLDQWQDATRDIALVNAHKEELVDAQKDAWLPAWSLAALLRDVINRYRYHFASESSAMSDDKRPEWAADFLMERLSEFTPFLRSVRRGADTALANIMLREFVSRRISHCRSSMSNELADEQSAAGPPVPARAISLSLYLTILQTLHQALQQASTVTVGLELRLGALDVADMLSPITLLMSDDWFMASWAAAEMNRIEAKVSEEITSQLRSSWSEDQGKSVVEAIRGVESICQLLVVVEIRSNLFRLTAPPVLSSIRSTIDAMATDTGDDAPGELRVEDLSDEQLRACCRAASLSSTLAHSLKERQESSSFYLLLEKEIGDGGAEDAQGQFARDIRLFEKEVSRFSSTVVRCIVDRFDADLKPYRNKVRYAELDAPNPDDVIAYDVSDEIGAAMELLERRLGIVAEAMGKTRTASSVWRQIAEELDRRFFEGIFMLSFVGGEQGSIEVATKENEFLSPNVRARILRQLCHDGSVLVSLFRIFTRKPPRYFQRLSEATTLVFLSISGADEWDKDADRKRLFQALDMLSTRMDQALIEETRNMLRDILRISKLDPREAKEMLIVSGRLLPPLD